MTLGDVRGAAVRLHPVAPHLVVGEGIETTLAASSGACRHGLRPPPATSPKPWPCRPRCER